MAYTATVSAVTRYTINGRRHYRFTVSETEAAAGSEFSVAGLPSIGRILQYRATRTAGTGTTIAPVVGRAASFLANTQDYIGNAFAAAASGNGAEMKYAGLTSGTMYFRSVPNNAASDHAISTEVVIVEGLH